MVAKKMHAMFREFKRLHRQSPTFLLAAYFFLILFTGTALLSMPAAQVPGGPQVTILTALFTAVSAFCVTGLTLVETSDAFTPFGHIVIMLLIELGGVGFMTFAALAFSMFGRRLSLAGKAALNDTLFQNNVSLEFKSLFASMLQVVILIQLAGVILLFLTLEYHTANVDTVWFNLWSALFHSISAFCNAGFSIYHGNLVPLANNRLFLAAIVGLVVLGGLGHNVLAELYRLPRLLRRQEKRPRWLSLNSRVTLVMTAILLVSGAIAVSIADAVYAPEGTFTLVDSVFHSVVSRTAGFNSAPLDRLPIPSCLFLCILMFIGGGPGSCAGGVKVTSLAIWIARINSNLRHDSRVNIAGYTIRPDLVSKARIIMALCTLWVTFGVIILSLAEPEVRLEALLFEQISALATVGLSMNITPSLSEFSQVWITISMFMGKFGPLTVALWMVPGVPASIGRPEGTVMVG